MDLKVAIAGIGSIGGIIATKLLASGKPITLITRNEDLTKQLIRNGIELDGKRIVLNSESMVITEPTEALYDVILLTMRANQVVEACSNLSNNLSANGYFVSLQNGMVEDDIMKIIAKDKITSGIVAFGGRKVALGSYIQSTFGSLHIGELYEYSSNRLETLKLFLEPGIPVFIHTDMKGALWSKLAINCSLNGLNAIVGGTIGSIFANKVTRKIVFELYKEVLEIASVIGVKATKLSVDPYLFYFKMNPTLFKNLKKLWLSFILWRRYRGSKASTLQSIENNRETEIEYITGYLIQVANMNDFNIPFNELAYLLIKKIENNELSIGYENLQFFSDLLNK